MRQLLFFFLILLIRTSHAQPPRFKSHGTGKYSGVYIYNGYLKDTIMIIDSLKNDTIKNYVCCDYRHAKFINDDGLILAKMSDGEGLLSNRGKLLNGPYNSGNTKLLENGYVITGTPWKCTDEQSTCLGQIIFNAKGDTVLCSKKKYTFYPLYTDSTALEGFNPKTKRDERGYLLSSGKWGTKEYLDPNGSWIRYVDEKRIKPKKR
jgi:hypothetical protein